MADDRDQNYEQGLSRRELLKMGGAALGALVVPGPIRKFLGPSSKVEGDRIGNKSGELERLWNLWGPPVFEATSANFDNGEQLMNTLARMAPEMNERVGGGLEYVIKKSVYEQMLLSGESMTSFVTRHVNRFNRMFQDADLESKRYLARLVVADDKLVDGLRYYKYYADRLPRGINCRWFQMETYGSGAYWNDEEKLNYGLLHEWGHYWGHAFDVYFEDLLPGENANLRARFPDGSSVSVEQQTFRSPDKWLMVGSNMSDSMLDPYTVGSLRRLDQLGIDNWTDAYDFYMLRRLQEFPESSVVDLRLPDGTRFRGRANVFVSKAKNYDFNYQQPDAGKAPQIVDFSPKKYLDDNPDFQLTVGTLPLILSKKLVGGPLTCDGQDVLGFGKDILITCQDSEGKKYVARLISEDFLLPFWQGADTPVLEIQLEEAE